MTHHTKLRIATLEQLLSGVAPTDVRDNLSVSDYFIDAVIRQYLVYRGGYRLA